MMLDTKRYLLMDNVGFFEKAEAYAEIKKSYNGFSGITTFFDNDSGLWYIVQSKLLSSCRY